MRGDFHHRGRGNWHRANNFDDEQSSSGFSGGRKFDRATNAYGRPPPGLRGRALGMWHAQRSRNPEYQNRKQKINEKIEERNRPVLKLDPDGAGFLRIRCDQLMNEYQKLGYIQPDGTCDASLVSVNDDSGPVEFETDFEVDVEDCDTDVNSAKESNSNELEAPVDDHTAPCGILRPVDRTKMDTLIKTEVARWERVRDTPLQRFRQALPAFTYGKELLAKISANQVVIVSGETGCGKSTQVPQIILENAFQNCLSGTEHPGTAPLPYIICTQPRRISAVSLAQRVASERQEPLGVNVGYQIRFDNRRPSNECGAILYCTTGVVMEWLKGRPDLAGVTHVILDEAHERDLCTDFMLIWMRRLLQRRLDIKVVVMSATLNAELFADYFGVDSSKGMLTIPGRTFPVERFYLEDILHFLPHNSSRSFPDKKQHRSRTMRTACLEEPLDVNYSAFDYVFEGEKPTTNNEYAAIETAKQIHYEQVKHGKLDLNLIGRLFSFLCENQSHPPDEAILIFVPGWSDIKQLIEHLTELSRANGYRCYFLALHSLLPSFDQNKVFQRSPAGQRKVIISTILAETSVTIDDVVHVIDTCKTKMNNFDQQLNLQTLKFVTQQ